MKKVRILCLPLMALLLSLTVTVAEGVNPTMIICKAPTTNSDGTPLTDLAELKAYLGRTSGTYTVYTSAAHTVIGTDRIFMISGIAGITSGLWYVSCTALDTSGNESVKSNEVAFTIETVTPSYPGCSVN